LVGFVALGLEAGPERFHLRAQRFNITRIIKHVVGFSDFLSIWNLVRETIARISLDGLLACSRVRT
jgi:hypothetical protein